MPNYDLNGLDDELLIFIDVQNNVWFRAIEFAKLLNYTKPYQINRQVDRKHILYFSAICKDMTKSPTEFKADTVFIDRIGIVELADKSNNLEVIRFTKWLLTKVIPAIHADENVKINATVQRKCGRK